MDERRVLSRFIDERASGRVVLVGNSMGGVIGILQAAVEPESRRRARAHGLAVPLDTRRPAAPGRASPAFAAYDAPGPRPAACSRHASGASTPSGRCGSGSASWSPTRRSISDEVVRLTVEQVRERGLDPDAPAAFLRRMAIAPAVWARDPTSRAERWTGVRCPVFVLHGRRDRLVPAAYADAALREHPAWRGRIFPDLGHVPQMEAPGRWLAEVADWYDEVLA